MGKTQGSIAKVLYHAQRCTNDEYLKISDKFYYIILRISLEQSMEIILPLNVQITGFLNHSYKATITRHNFQSGIDGNMRCSVLFHSRQYRKWRQQERHWHLSQILDGHQIWQWQNKYSRGWGFCWIPSLEDSSLFHQGWNISTDKLDDKTISLKVKVFAESI